MKHKSDFSQALAYMEQAFQVSQSCPDRALAEEYLNLLIDSGRYEEAWRFYHTLSEEHAGNDRIQIIVGAAALKLNEEAFLNELFKKEFAVVREGEMLIIDLWYSYQAQKIAERMNEPLSDNHLEEAKRNCPPPNNIDFRIVGD